MTDELKPVSSPLTAERVTQQEETEGDAPRVDGERCVPSTGSTAQSATRDVPSSAYEPVARYDRLIDVLRRLRPLIEEIADEVHGDEVTKALRGHPTPFGQFDAGHLCAAETIIRAEIDPGYPGLARYDADDCNRRLVRAVKLLEATRAPASPQEPNPDWPAFRDDGRTPETDQ